MVVRDLEESGKTITALGVAMAIGSDLKMSDLG